MYEDWALGSDWTVYAKDLYSDEYDNKLDPASLEADFIVGDTVWVANDNSIRAAVVSASTHFDASYYALYVTVKYPDTPEKQCRVEKQFRVRRDRCFLVSQEAFDCMWRLRRNESQT